MAKDSKKTNSMLKWVVVFIIIVLALYLIIPIFFNDGNPINTTCLPINGYWCTNVMYQHTTGNVTLTLRQETGTNWASATIYFVPQGTQIINGTPSSITNGSSGNIIIDGLNNGQNVSVTLAISSPTSTQAGKLVSGQIWSKYWTSSGGPYYAQIAVITMKAV